MSFRSANRPEKVMLIFFKKGSKHTSVANSHMYGYHISVGEPIGPVTLFQEKHSSG